MIHDNNLKSVVYQECMISHSKSDMALIKKGFVKITKTVSSKTIKMKNI